MRKPAEQLKILVLTFTPIASEPRALKQIHYLKDKYDVTTAGFGPAPYDDIEHIELDPKPKAIGPIGWRGVYPAMLLSRRFKWIAKNFPRSAAAYGQLRSHQWDIIIAHDVATIPTANRLQPRMGVLSDLHEYAPRQYEHSRLWRVVMAPYMRWLVLHEVTQAQKVTTVSKGIVDEYRQQFGVESTLVTNATPFRQLPTGPVKYPIKLVHSGIPSRARQLETMILGVKDSKADVTLDLFLMNTDDEYLAELKALAGDDKRIHFCDPVPYSQLIETLNQYDVGLSLIAPNTFNLKWCLPNKFFDFIQARLGVIIGPSAEMANFVDKYGIGAITADFTAGAFSELLSTLTPGTVEEWKRASAHYADDLSGEKQVQIWGRLVAEIVEQNGIGS